MRAVTYNFTIPRYLIGRGLGGLTDAAIFGWLSGVRLRHGPDPAPPGPEWVELDVLAAGVCGTDMATLAGHTSPLLEPFGSFPAVLGHEILARVRAVGGAVTRVAVGQRVAVDPLLGCRVRGYPDADHCASCRAGWPATCARSGEEGPLAPHGRPLARGITIGYHRDLPGGWGERLVAHESQLFSVDERLSDHEAVLLEPLSVAVHAAVGVAVDRGARVLVVGGGPIGLATIWALRALGHHGPIVAQAKREPERTLASELGASEVVTPGPEVVRALRATGAVAYRPPIGAAVYAGGGFDAVFDCVGSAASLDQALRFTTPRGRVVMLGCAATVRADLTFLWARELAVQGFLAYGWERHAGASLHTFELAHRLLVATEAPVGRLVTHAYPLRHYRAALAAARHRRTSGAVKVVLTPR